MGSSEGEEATSSDTYTTSAYPSNAPTFRPTSEPTLILIANNMGPETIPDTTSNVNTVVNTLNTPESLDSLFSFDALAFKPLECGNITTRSFVASEAMDGVIAIPQDMGYGVFTLDFTPHSGSIFIFAVNEESGDLTFRSSYNFTNSWSGHFTNTMGRRLWVLVGDTADDGEEFSISMTCTQSDLEGIFGDVLSELGGVDDIDDVAVDWDSNNSLKWYHIVGIVMMVLMANAVFCIWCYLKKEKNEQNVGGGGHGVGFWQKRHYDQHGGGNKLQML